MQPQVHFKVSVSLGLQGASTPPGRCPLTPPGALIGYTPLFMSVKRLPVKVYHKVVVPNVFVSLKYLRYDCTLFDQI